jgi:hypothetical protein
MAVRIELHAINTMTLSDAQFLTGDANGKATVTTGQLRVAAGSGRLPVVVLQHGSGGIAANIDLWERELNAVGVTTFALDGFTGRGLIQVNTDQTLLGRLNTRASIRNASCLWASHAVAKLRCTRASNASTRCGTDRVSILLRTFRSILIALPHTCLTQTLQTAPSAFLGAHRTITIQSGFVRRMWSGSKLPAGTCKSPSIQMHRTLLTFHSFRRPLWLLVARQCAIV